MKAIRIEGGQPLYIEAQEPGTDGVRIKVASSSICGSDLHMVNAGWAEGRILGHEFAGVTDDGTAVTVQPNFGCGKCHSCEQGYTAHCDEGTVYFGVFTDGGMAEYVRVPEAAVFPLPTGIQLADACLMEPLAVSAHGLNRARVTEKDRVLVVGAGPIGLAAAAILKSRGMTYDITARYEHQKQAAELLGGNTEPSGHYDVVVDAVGNTASIAEAIQHCKPMGRIAFVGTLWEDASIDMSFCSKEIELIAATTYRSVHPKGEFHEAGKALSAVPEIARALISHRFPLEAASEAFTTANNRASGAIKVAFEL